MARWASPRTARKSTARERPDTEAFVPRAGPTRLSGRAWAATSARRPNTGTTRFLGQPDAARWPVSRPTILHINKKNPNSLILPPLQPPPSSSLTRLCGRRASAVCRFFPPSPSPTSGQPQWYRHIALYTKLHVSNSKGKRQPVYQVSFQSKHNK
jgi:hypothetical protein